MLEKKSIAFKNIWIFIKFLLIKQLISYRNALHNYVHIYILVVTCKCYVSHDPYPIDVYYMSTCFLYLYREILKLSSKLWWQLFRIPNRTYHQNLRCWHKVDQLPKPHRTSWIHLEKSLDPPPSHSRRRTAEWPQSWHRTSPGTSSRGGRC